MPSTSALLVVVLLQGCVAFPGGPPASLVCGDIAPQHPGSPASGNGGYLITTDIPVNSAGTGYEYTPDTTYTVTLTGTVNTFRGFAVRGVSIVDGSPLGSFTPGTNQQLLACTPPDYTIVHNNPSRNDFSEQTFTWQAPSTAGDVNFVYSVVRFRMDTGEYYVRLSAIGEAPPTQPPASTRPPIDPTQEGVVMPSIAPSNYRLIIKNPISCNVSDCSIFVGIGTNEGNGDFLNFYIEGEASAWVAVGFSSSSSMFSTDVLACNHNTNDEVDVLDTWNAAGGRSNVPDRLEDTFRFSSSTVDGRIKCSFGRSIAGSDDSQDFDLNNDYYVLIGRSNGGRSTGFLNTHRSGADRNPLITGQRLIAAQGMGVFGADNDSIKRALVQTHGILMLIAWPFLASIGVFFAAHLRPLFSKGEWFQVHRAFMIGSLFVAAAAFVIVFFSQLDSMPRGLIDLGTGSALQRTRTAHFVFGIIVMALHIANPIIAIFRCHPGEKNRVIFDLLHGFPGVGAIAYTLAMVNVALGLVIFGRDFSRFGNLTLFWVYFGHTISTLSYFLGSSVFKFIYKVIGWAKKEPDDFTVKTDKMDDEKVNITGSEDKEKKEDCKKCGEDQSQCSRIGTWIGVSLFFVFTVAVPLTLIVLVALPLP